jgi:hypothetical protein
MQQRQFRFKTLRYGFHERRYLAALLGKIHRKYNALEVDHPEPPFL